DSKLDGVWRARDDGPHSRGHILDAGQKARFIEKTVVDGDIEAIAVGAKEPVQTWGDGHTGTFLSGSPTMASLSLLSPSLTRSSRSLHVRHASASICIEWKTPIQTPRLQVGAA